MQISGINFETVQATISVISMALVPIVTLWVRSIVDGAVKRADDRLSAFELKMSETMGDHKAHIKESELRHTAHEQRLEFLERQWQALHERTDLQQRFQHEIVKTQEAISGILGKMLEKLGA
jgi:hypothetical protein